MKYIRGFKIEELLGKTFDDVFKTFDDVLDTRATLEFVKGSQSFTFYHEQDCCEKVYIESVVGDLQDLVGTPILKAEEVTSRESGSWDSSYTYTFYKFATIKGYVDVRWVGESNGYYSEKVDMGVFETKPR